MQSTSPQTPSEPRLPSVQTSAHQVWLTTLVAIVAGGCAVVSTVLVWSWWYTSPRGALAEEVALIAGIAWLVCGAFTCAWLLARARQVIAESSALQAVSRPSDAPGLFGNSVDQERESVIAGQRTRLVSLARFFQLPLGGLPLLAAGATLLVGWPSANSQTTGELHLAVLALVCAFPVLILERSLAQQQLWVDASRLLQVTRTALLVLIAISITTGLHVFGIDLAYWGQRLIAAMLLVMLGELLVRSFVMALMPSPSPEQARVWYAGFMLAACSGLAGGGGLGRVFRLDLSQSYGLMFMRQASGPLLLVLLLATWAITSVHILGPNERGVSERFGVPVRVHGPGLVTCLPWPFGTMRRIENGQVHLVALSLGLGNTAGGNEIAKLDAYAKAKAGDPLAAPPAITAEAQPPAEYDRLWEKAHGAESVFLVPSQGAGDRGQSYQLLNADVRIIWRIASSDAAALASAYRVTDPSRLVRVSASQALTVAFQRRTLAMVIASDRESLAASVRSDVQAQLNDMQSGIEIHAVVIDAIHPPPGAALSYHGVQAAGIIAVTDINIARSQQVRSRHEADLAATSMRENRQAVAREISAKAEVERLRFTADRDSSAIGAEALALERWLQALGQALGRSQLTIVDASISREEAPFLDFRPTALPNPMSNKGQP